LLIAKVKRQRYRLGSPVDSSIAKVVNIALMPTRSERERYNSSRFSQDRISRINKQATMKFFPSSGVVVVLFCLLVAATTLTKNAQAFHTHVPCTTTMSPSTAAMSRRLQQLSRNRRRDYLHLLLFAASSSPYKDDDHNNDDHGNDNKERPQRSYEEALEHNKKRTDVRRLLTQRALQNFIYLLVECRDPHTVRWLEVSKRKARAML
jgi:hypothetical protein